MAESVKNPDAQAGGNRLFILAVIAVVILGLGVVAVLATNREDGAQAVASGEATAPIELIGDSVPPMPEGVRVSDSTNDPVIGTVAPTLIASGFDGEQVTVEADGTPKAIYFLAHWCPHCQEELPMVQTLISDGQKPDNLEVYGVSTAVDQGRGNFPPQDWFEVEGFTGSVLRDDDASSAIAAFGGSGFPYAIYLDGENRIVARTSGNLDAAATQQIWELTANGG